MESRYRLKLFAQHLGAQRKLSTGFTLTKQRQSQIFPQKKDRIAIYSFGGLHADDSEPHTAAD